MYRWLLALLAALIGLGLLRLGLAQPRGRLHFDGCQWWWLPEGGATQLSVQLELALDLQSHMLLRCQALTTNPQAQWMCVSHSSAPQEWFLFRRAVYWRATPATPIQTDPTAP